MQVTAKARYIRFSPFKLRVLVDVVRGKNVAYALNWLKTYRVKRAEPIQKMIASAVANAQQREPNIKATDLAIKEIKVDQGPSFRYFTPGSKGMAKLQRRRMSHMSVILEPVVVKKTASTKKEV